MPVVITPASVLCVLCHLLTPFPHLREQPVDRRIDKPIGPSLTALASDLGSLHIIRIQVKYRITIITCFGKLFGMKQICYNNLMQVRSMRHHVWYYALNREVCVSYAIN